MAPLRCSSCGVLLSPLERGMGTGRCCTCDDDAIADTHDERCDCGACERVRSRYGREAREREAATCGGLSDFGREVLGW